MTIIEKSSFTGVNQFETRPHARVRMGQQLKAVAEDQAYAYKLLTGVAVPNAPGSDVAANHIHDGTNGAQIPIPVAQEWLGANLQRGTVAGGYAPLIWFPIFCPPGFTKYRLYLTSNKPDALANIARVKVQNSSLETVSGGTNFVRVRDANDPVASSFVVYSEITTTADALNVIRVECLEGLTAPQEVDVISYSLVPYFGDPLIYQMPDRMGQNTTILGPTATEHLGAHPFTSYDDGMFDDDDAVSSYLVNTMNKNNVYLIERASGRPAGNRDDSSNSIWQGHGHGGRTTVGTKSTNLGDEIDHVLGAWAYGTQRGGPSGNHPSVDMANASNTTWTGRIFAPCLKDTISASTEFVRHPVRLPLMRSTAAYANNTGDLKAAFLVYKDHSKDGNLTITATMRSGGGTTAASNSQTVSTVGTSTGWYLLTVSGLEAQGTTDGEVEQMLSISMARTGSSGAGGVLYGACLYLQP